MQTSKTCKMFTRVLVIIVTTLTYTCLGTPIGGRIVNGTDAKPGEIPYIISLRYSNRHNCGGSFLTSKHIMTAAHCVSGYPATSLSVQYGVTHLDQSPNALNVVAVSKATVHPNYSAGGGYLNDIALLQLAEEIPFGTYVQPVTLPRAFNATPENQPALLSGWGLPYSGGSVMDDLQRVDIKVFSDDECESMNSVTGPASREYHVCAGIDGGGKGQCNGDSGGPLIVDGFQVGIVSWSVKPCTRPGYPGVFTKVSRHVDWINKELSDGF